MDPRTVLYPALDAFVPEADPVFPESLELSEPAVEVAENGHFVETRIWVQCSLPEVVNIS